MPTRSPADSAAQTSPDAGRLTILQIIPALATGGAERSCVEVASAIVEAGGKALVASTGGGLTAELRRAGARHVTLPLATKSPVGIYRNIRAIVALARDEQVTLLHARSRAPAWSTYYAARRLDLPFVTTFHAPYNHRSALKRAYNGIMARGDRVIANSHHVADHVARTYRVGTERLRVIPRGVDIDRFSPKAVSPQRLVQLAERWRLADGMPVILMPARLTRWKGHEVVLDALAKLERRDIRCLMVGSDQGRARYRQALVAKIAALGLEDVVHLTDHCDDMPAAFMLSDVVVHASTDAEGFGRVLIEAQAMGRPVVYSDLGGPRETVLDGETGWGAKPGDADALARAVAVALALSPEQRHTLAEAARTHVKLRFSTARMTRSTLSVYAELLGPAQG